MHEADGHRALPHGRRHALDRPRAHVAHRQHAGPARLEHLRRRSAVLAGAVEAIEIWPARRFDDEEGPKLDDVDRLFDALEKAA